MDYPSLFTAFQEARDLIQGDEISALEYYNLGNLVITSGKILACDPYYCAEAEPFITDLVPPGEYPVIVSVAHIKNDQRVALAAIFIGDALPLNWKIATPSGIDLTKRKRYTYCVDSGIGCFMDADAVNAFALICEDYDIDTDPLLAEMSRHYTHTWGWANLCLNQATGTNIIAFSSGWGDGGYPSYFGYDENENIICLVTEFGVLDEAE